MAKRRKDTPADAISTAVILVLFAASGYVLSVLSVAFTIAYYAAPLAALLAYAYVQKQRRNFPEIPNPAEYRADGPAHEVRQAILAKAGLLEEVERLYARGTGSGLYLTKGSNETRFDTRSKLGRELNAGIDVAAERIRALSNDIVGVRSRVGTSLPFYDWHLEVDEWHRWETSHSALRKAGVVFLASAVGAYVISLFGGSRFSFLLVVAALIALISYALFKRFQPVEWSDKVDARVYADWLELSDKWTGQDFEHHFVDGSEEEPSPETDEVSDWHLVLNVAASSSPDEIKSAYRNAVKNYHPDRVAGLGEKLREVAESETRRLNAAYQAARLQKGF